MKRFLIILTALLLPLAVAAQTTPVGNLVVQKSLTLKGAISPTQITADQNNYAPTGFADAATLRLSTDASRTITGLAGGAAGRSVAVYNVGSFNLVLANQSSSSTTTNRFAISADITLVPNGPGVVLQYDATTGRWRAQGAPSSGGGGSAAWGSITGTLSDQTDLQTALDDKISGVAWGQITGTLSSQSDLQTAFDAKVDVGTIVGNGQTMNEARLLGRGAGLGVGPIGEITVGTGLDLSAGGALTATNTGTVTSVTSANAAATVATTTTTPVITIVSAPKWTTARNLAGNSVDGSANATFANKFIVQGTTDSGLTGAQFLGALATGILKSTTTTGVLSIAIAADFPTLNQSTTGSAATLTTPRAINGVNFDGSAAITVPAAAGTLTGATLASGVTASSLTSVGTMTSGTIDSGFVVKGVTMTLGSDANYDLYYRNSSGVLTRLPNGTTGQFLAATTSSAPSWGTPSGSGTVTHTGSLTANALVLGNGSADTTVSTAFVTDGTSVMTVGVAGASTSGALVIKGKTSGSLRFAVNDATAQAIIVGLSAQTTGGATLAIPNMAGVGDTFTFNTLAATLSNKTLASPVLDLGLTTASGAFNVDFSSFTGTTKTTTGATTLGSSATVNGANISNEIPPNVQNGSYTLVLTDAGKHISCTSGSGTWTIPANSSVAFPIGTAVTFVVRGAITRTIAITTDTLEWAGSASTGSRTLTGNGEATAIKVASTAWMISGPGLSLNEMLHPLMEPDLPMLALATIHEFPIWAEIEEAA